MCCETRRPSELRCFAATTQKTINIGESVAKKKALDQTAWKRNLLTRHKPYKHWTLCFKLDGWPDGKSDRPLVLAHYFTLSWGTRGGKGRLFT